MGDLKSIMLTFGSPSIIYSLMLVFKSQTVAFGVDADWLLRVDTL